MKMLVMFSISAENFGPLMTSIAKHMSNIEDLRIESQEEKKRRSIRQETLPKIHIPEIRINNVVNSKVQMLILKELYNHKAVFHTQMIQLMIKNNFKAKSASAARSMLMQEGLITVSDKKYSELTEKGIEFCKQYFGDKT